MTRSLPAPRLRCPRRFRRDPPDPEALTAALTAMRLAAPDPDGTWHATASARAAARYRAIAAAAPGRDLTRRDMIEVLIGAGYSAASAGSGPAAARTRPAVIAAARASESETRARVTVLLGGAGAGRCRVVAIRFLAV